MSASQESYAGLALSRITTSAHMLLFSDVRPHRQAPPRWEVPLRRREAKPQRVELSLVQGPHRSPRDVRRRRQERRRRRPQLLRELPRMQSRHGFVNHITCLLLSCNCWINSLNMKLSAYIVLTKLMNPDRERGLAEQLQLLLVLVFFRPGIGRRRLRPHP